MSCYPNPFNKETNFEIQSSNSIKDIWLYIYSLNGDLVKSWKLENNTSGNHTSVKWDGTNLYNKNCKAGIYIASLKTRKETLQQIKIIKYD